MASTTTLLASCCSVPCPPCGACRALRTAVAVSVDSADDTFAERIAVAISADSKVPFSAAWSSSLLRIAAADVFVVLVDLSCNRMIHLLVV